MATTGKQNGTLTYFSRGGTQVTHLIECSLDVGMDLIDVTTKDSSGWSESLAGLRNASMSGSGYYADNATEGYDDIITDITGRASATVRLTTGVSGDAYIEFTGYCTSLTTSAGTEDARTFDFSYQATGAPTVGTEA